jgi:hypothetical protein
VTLSGDTITALAILTRADELLSEPSKWTQSTSARDSDGNPTALDGPRAACWCLHGAIIRANKELADGDPSKLEDSEPECEEAEDALDACLMDSFPVAPKGYVDFNDRPGTTFEDVKHLLRCAIADRALP